MQPENLKKIIADHLRFPERCVHVHCFGRWADQSTNPAQSEVPRFCSVRALRRRSDRPKVRHQDSARHVGQCPKAVRCRAGFARIALGVVAPNRNHSPMTVRFLFGPLFFLVASLRFGKAEQAGAGADEQPAVGDGRRGDHTFSQIVDSQFFQAGVVAQYRDPPVVARQIDLSVAGDG